MIDATNKPIGEKIQRLFKLQGNQSKSSNSFAVTTPSVLGYSFNPASFYFVINDEDYIEWPGECDVSKRVGHSILLEWKNSLTCDDST